MDAKSRICILIVDDDEHALDALAELLQTDGYDVIRALSARQALESAAVIRPDAVITDLHMPEMDGLELFGKLHEQHPDLTVIILTGHGDLASALQAIHEGAEHYLTKPVDYTELSSTLGRALSARALASDGDLRERLGLGLGPLVGASLTMQNVYRQAERVAPARSTVLITGESGTGKGELATLIHRLGPRSESPLRQVQCAALAESLVESELFGHEKGSFTGAGKRRIGRFEEADGGTLFLDEVGEISSATQIKLLRVLQERKLERVGGEQTIDVDVRLIAATNRDLALEVQQGRFREDLYYRLHVVRIDMPPLRERRGDIPLLADFFLHKRATAAGKEIRGFTDEARGFLEAHTWPGNVRELDNAIERAVVLCGKSYLGIDDLHELAASSDWGELNTVPIPGATMSEIERHAILATLGAVDGSTTKAARILGISPRTIQHRLKDWGMARPRGRRPRRSRRGARDETDIPTR